MGVVEEEEEEGESTTSPSPTEVGDTSGASDVRGAVSIDGVGVFELRE